MDDLRTADNAYRPISTFSPWSQLTVDANRWERVVGRIRGQDTSLERLKRAQQVATRAAAFDTGAIEKLYASDRGITFTIAFGTAAFEAAFQGGDVQRARTLFEAQLAAYDEVLDLATKVQPITEAWIRQLHTSITIGQDTYRAHTELGVQELPLPRGRYKTSSNHVRLPDGLIHSYAPVDQVASEMHRLVQQLSSEEFQGAHPVLQAAFAHYAFVAIHPFADGNGRVARALGSIYSYRAAHAPLLILVEHRDRYFRALEAADGGQLQPFVDFVEARCLEAIELMLECLATADVRQPGELAAEIGSLFRTRAGYTHQEVDSTAYSLIELVFQALEIEAAKHQRQGELSIAVNKTSATAPLTVPGLRLPVAAGANSILLQIVTSAPAHTQINHLLVVQVPIDYGVDDELVVQSSLHPKERFTARIEDVQTNSGVLQVRLRMFVERVLSRDLTKAYGQATTQLRGIGYRR